MAICVHSLLSAKAAAAPLGRASHSLVEPTSARGDQTTRRTRSRAFGSRRAHAMRAMRSRWLPHGTASVFPVGRDSPSRARFRCCFKVDELVCSCLVMISHCSLLLTTPNCEQAVRAPAAFLCLARVRARARRDSYHKSWLQTRPRWRPRQRRWR